MTTPKINISLNLPELSVVVREFQRKGYKMTDEFLLNEGDLIDEIDFILGANSAHCFSEKIMLFG